MEKLITKLLEFIIMSKFMQLVEIIKLLFQIEVVIFLTYIILIYVGEFRRWFVKKMDDLDKEFKNK